MGYLSVMSSIFTAINTQRVHPTLYPVALGPALHATRVSMIYQSFARRSPIPLSMGQHLVGFLLMAWGGGLLSNWFLGLPAPMLHSSIIAFNYVFIHLALKAVFDKFPSLLDSQLLDTILWPLDAILRTNGIASSLDLLSSPKVHQEYRNSPLTHMLIGAIVSSGGGVIVGTISGTTNWTFSTPPFLRSGAGWDGTLDVWGGALVGLIYGTLTGHRAFSSVGSFVTFSGEDDPLHVTALTGRVVAATVLGVLFAAKTYKTHWRAQPQGPGVVRSEKSHGNRKAVSKGKKE